MTPAEMNDHVLSICAEHAVVVAWCKRPGRAYALREFEEIVIAPVKSEISYAVALHEIGHVRGRHQGSNRIFVRERGAWQWARKSARTWTPRMERYAQASLGWYAARDMRS